MLLPSLQRRPLTFSSLIWTPFEIFSSSSATLQFYKNLALAPIAKYIPPGGHKQCSTDRFHKINELKPEGKNEFVLYVHAQIPV